MWFVFNLESQDGKDGRQQERQRRGLHSHTLGRECIQGLLNHATNRAQGHHLGNGGITSGVGVLSLPRGAALVVLPCGDPSVCPVGGSQPWGKAAGIQGPVLSMGLGKDGSGAAGEVLVSPGQGEQNSPVSRHSTA